MKTTLLSAAAMTALTIGAANAAVTALDSVKESHIRESQTTTNQGQTRLILGAQGSSGSEFRVMMQFDMADLSSSIGAGSTINSINLDLGNAFSWSGLSSASTFELRAWAVSDFDVTDNTWNDPQGSAGADVAGATLGTVLSTEGFDNTVAQGDFIFGSETAFVNYIQNAYDSNPNDKINFLVIMKDDGTYENAIPRTDSGSITGIGTATLNITSIPEPSSAALLGLGGLALILRRRK